MSEGGKEGKKEGEKEGRREGKGKSKSTLIKVLDQRLIFSVTPCRMNIRRK